MYLVAEVADTYEEEQKLVYYYYYCLRICLSLYGLGND